MKRLAAAQIRRRAFAEHVASGKSATEAYCAILATVPEDAIRERLAKRKGAK